MTVLLCAWLTMFCLSSEPSQSLGISPVNYEMHVTFRDVLPTKWDSANACELHRKWVESEMRQAAKLKQIESEPQTECKAVVQ